ncbi:hypothetical protein EDD16DRAFT_1527738 [Pisolithus croceorrhizus]|nr:hypothetical protein EDD16DRAFT_1527738 [Pisolithus croceorrhizus]KAI6101394.1 hypothetical protein EV401DRAFT_1894207 [Pisolithus croceorrhizus]KAI6138000.1 hypothetical protein EDD17DRAFT_1516990 [Pisolithus thermaeus]
MQAQASKVLKQSTGGQYYCVCIKSGFRCIHKVSHMAWLKHLANASSEEEHQQIHTTRLLGEQITSLPPLANPSLPLTHNYSAPLSVHMIEALQGLTNGLPTSVTLKLIPGYSKMVGNWLSQPVYPDDSPQRSI